jgi:hypothetical protein
MKLGSVAKLLASWIPPKRTGRPSVPPAIRLSPKRSVAWRGGISLMKVVSSRTIS